MARGNAAGFADPREKGKLEIYEAEPALDGAFTLHDASLSGDMHAAVQKVKGNGVYPLEARERRSM